MLITWILIATFFSGVAIAQPPITRRNCLEMTLQELTALERGVLADFNALERARAGEPVRLFRTVEVRPAPYAPLSDRTAAEMAEYALIDRDLLDLDRSRWEWIELGRESNHLWTERTFDQLFPPDFRATLRNPTRGVGDRYGRLIEKLVRFRAVLKRRKLPTRAIDRKLTELVRGVAFSSDEIETALRGTDGSAAFQAFQAGMDRQSRLLKKFGIPGDLSSQGSALALLRRARAEIQKARGTETPPVARVSARRDPLSPSRFEFSLVRGRGGRGGGGGGAGPEGQPVAPSVEVLLGSARIQGRARKVAVLSTFPTGVEFRDIETLLAGVRKAVAEKGYSLALEDRQGVRFSLASEGELLPPGRVQDRLLNNDFKVTLVQGDEPLGARLRLAREELFSNLQGKELERRIARSVALKESTRPQDRIRYAQEMALLETYGIEADSELDATLVRWVRDPAIDLSTKNAILRPFLRTHVDRVLGLLERIPERDAGAIVATWKASYRDVIRSRIVAFSPHLNAAEDIEIGDRTRFLLQNAFSSETEIVQMKGEILASRASPLLDTLRRVHEERRGSHLGESIRSWVADPGVSIEDKVRFFREAIRSAPKLVGELATDLPRSERLKVLAGFHTRSGDMGSFRKFIHDHFGDVFPLLMADRRYLRRYLTLHPESVGLLAARWKRDPEFVEVLNDVIVAHADASAGLLKRALQEGVPLEAKVYDVIQHRLGRAQKDEILKSIDDWSRSSREKIAEVLMPGLDGALFEHHLRRIARSNPGLASRIERRWTSLRLARLQEASRPEFAVSPSYTRDRPGAVVRRAGDAYEITWFEKGKRAGKTIRTPASDDLPLREAETGRILVRTRGGLVIPFDPSGTGHAPVARAGADELLFSSWPEESPSVVFNDLGVSRVDEEGRLHVMEETLLRDWRSRPDRVPSSGRALIPGARHRLIDGTVIQFARNGRFSWRPTARAAADDVFIGREFVVPGGPVLSERLADGRTVLVTQGEPGFPLYLIRQGEVVAQLNLDPALTVRDIQLRPDGSVVLTTLQGPEGELRFQKLEIVPSSR